MAGIVVSVQTLTRWKRAIPLEDVGGLQAVTEARMKEADAQRAYADANAVVDGLRQQLESMEVRRASLPTVDRSAA